MNTEGDYLWDRTGEPDPEIQQLEEVLGALRYQPRPLEIPAGLQVGRERSFFRAFATPLAVAAAIATLLLGLGLWLGLQRLQRTQPQQIVKSPETPQMTPNPAAVSSPEKKQNAPLLASTPRIQPEQNDKQRRHQLALPLQARNSNPARKTVIAEQLTLKQQQEALAAKDQLMLALRVTSAKLNLAQKKAQSTTTPDLIHNQHKIG